MLSGARKDILHTIQWFSSLNSQIYISHMSGNYTLQEATIGHMCKVNITRSLRFLGQQHRKLDN